MYRRSLYLVVLVLALFTADASARVIRVDRRSSAGSPDGSSWSGAFRTVTLGIAVAQAGDEIWVAAGIYPERLVMKPGVGLYGGFVGTEAHRAQRPGRPDLTVLDGMLINTVVRFPPGTTPDTVLDGFTIRNGRSASGGGGGIRCEGSPIIAHNVITSNAADDKGFYSGGGIFCISGNPIIRDNVIVANSGNGGGIAVQSGGPQITHNTFSMNNTSAITLYGAPLPTTLIANNIIAGNMIGLVVNTGSPIAIRHNCFHGNAVADTVLENAATVLRGNLFADPQFVDAEHSQFHIQPSSPCIDAGDNSIVETGETDIDLLPRRVGQAVDIGADESDGRTWPPPFVPVVHVSTGGADTNDGLSWETAKATVQAGIDLAAGTGGGEVWVASGEYAAQRPAFNARSIYQLRPFVQLYGGFSGTETGREERDWNYHPSILHQSLSLPIVGILAGHRATTLDGLILHGSPTASSFEGGVSCVSASAIIRNNAIFGVMGSGVYTNNTSPVIEWNTIRGNSFSGGSAGVYADNSIVIIRNNIIAANTSPRNYAFTGALVLLSSTGIITNNLIKDNTSGGTIISQTGVALTNNTFVNNGVTAIQVGTGSIVTFANNISAFHDQAPMITEAPGRIIRNNCVFDAATGTFPVGRNGNIAAYPMFTDLWDDNYRLSPGSPCVDKGDDAYVASGDLDLDGNLRLFGAHVDMGAYESPWIGVVTGRELAVGLLRIVGGLSPAAPGDGMTADTGAPAGLDIADVIRILR